ncbi:MAG: DUF3768 domain-containing protein [Patescibacteria group bacterium]
MVTRQMEDTRSQVAILNDQFRRSGFGVTLTCGVQSVKDLPGLLQAIKEFNVFNENNDPWGEHDFGRLDWHGDKVFWKIDYYDQELQAWEDPLTGSCRRIMTVMLADEY